MATAAALSKGFFMTTSFSLSSKDISQQPLLGVNIDHVTTLRQARGVHYPSESFRRGLIV